MRRRAQDDDTDAYPHNAVASTPAAAAIRATIVVGGRAEPRPSDTSSPWSTRGKAGRHNRTVRGRQFDPWVFG